MSALLDYYTTAISRKKLRNSKQIKIRENTTVLLFNSSKQTIMTEIQNQIVYLRVRERRDSCSTFQKSKRLNWRDLPNFPGIRHRYAKDQFDGAVGLTQGSSISGLQVKPVKIIQVDGIFILWRIFFFGFYHQRIGILTMAGQWLWGLQSCVRWIKMVENHWKLDNIMKQCYPTKIQNKLFYLRYFQWLRQLLISSNKRIFSFLRRMLCFNPNLSSVGILNSDVSFWPFWRKISA